MSMPEFPLPNPDMTSECALTMILSSIAMEEAALSHIINAEGEKIQFVLGSHRNGLCPASTCEILEVNKSVNRMLEMVMQNQLLLKNKMERVLEYLPKPPPSCFPCPPVLPCPVPPHCPMPSPCPAPCPAPAPCPISPPCPVPTPSPIPCPAQARSFCFEAVPGSYGCGGALRWNRDSACGRIAVDAADTARILLPSAGKFVVSVCLDDGVCQMPQPSVAAELVINCGEKCPIRQKLCHTVSNCRAVLAVNTVIQLPCSCSPCSASVFIQSPGCTEITHGSISFVFL